MTDSMYMHVCIDRLHIWETCQPKKKDQHFVDLQLIWFTGGPTTLQSLNKRCKEVTSFESYRFSYYTLSRLRYRKSMIHQT